MSRDRAAVRLFCRAAVILCIAASGITVPIIRASPEVHATDVQSSPVSPAANAVHLLLDISGSMADPDPTGRIKMEGAKISLLEFLKGLTTGAAIGLRSYPDQGLGDCNDGQLRYPLERQDPADVSAVIRGLQPGGGTPTAEALLAAAQDVRISGFPSATIVLVSDGESTCDDPCEAAAQIVASGLQIQVISVGFQISDVGASELECIARTTGGRYVDIDDGEELKKIFVDLSVPRLALSIDHPRDVVAEVGFESSGVVTVRATLRNEGQLAATNVQARIQFESASPGVTAPVRALGNLEPGAAALTVDWRFRPGLLVAGQTIEFAVVVRADNIPTDLGQSGAVQVLDPTSADELGAYLRDKRVAIMGDSFSAGEGADDYLDGTDTTDNRCHRSLDTYAVSVLEIPGDAILACSGAVAADITVANEQNGVLAQKEQLRNYQRSNEPVDTVLLTLGGNDVGFEKLAYGCILGDCSSEIDGRTPAAFLDAKFTGFTDAIIEAYTAIDSTLNSAEAVSERGGMASIIVLGYPRPAPSVDRRCLGIGADLKLFELDFFSATELATVNKFLTRLNGEIEAATEVARKLPGDKALPVFFVPFVEDSFLPDHTVCDSVPYARGLDSLNGAALDLDLKLSDIALVLQAAKGPQAATVALVKRFGPSIFNWIQRSVRELFHPNDNGYKAMTSALIRWSRSAAADSVQVFLDDIAPRPKAVKEPCTEIADGGELQGSSAPQVLNSCTTYVLVVEGFLPGAPTSVVVNSSPRTLAVVNADPTGKVSTSFMLPPGLPTGSHTLVASGYGADGAYRESGLPIVIEDDDKSKTPLVLGFGSLGLCLVGASLFVGGRRSRRAVS